MISRILKYAGIMSQEERDNKLYNDLIRHEGRIGGKLFGPVPKGHKREFFCLDENTWIWHEEWRNESGKLISRTARYEVRPDSIVKVLDGKYSYLSKSETARFLDAVRVYDNRVNQNIYSRA